jgi:hypothetical protein
MAACRSADRIERSCERKTKNMRKILSMYRKYMLRPIVYKAVTRLSIVAVLSLVWDRYTSEGLYSIWEGPLLVFGVVLLGWAWLGYLKLDGMTVHHLLEDVRHKPKKKHYATRSIVDFADEKIISFEELEPEERTFCSMMANLLLGLPLVAGGVLASLL